jgi:hypothetical protein
MGYENNTCDATRPAVCGAALALLSTGLLPKAVKLVVERELFALLYVPLGKDACGWMARASSVYNPGLVCCISLRGDGGGVEGASNRKSLGLIRRHGIDTIVNYC